MTLSQDKQKVLARLKAFKVPCHVAHELYHEVTRLSRLSGEEWTVSRLKEYRVDFMRYLAGQKPVGSYAKRSDGTPKGVFGYFWRTSLTSSKIRTAFKALSLHRLFVGRSPTKAQLRKFYDSVRRPTPSVDLPLSASAVAVINRIKSSKSTYSVESGYYRNIRPGRKTDFETWISSPSRRAPRLKFSEPAEPTWQPLRVPSKGNERDTELKDHLNFLLFPELDQLRDRIAVMLPNPCRDYVYSNYPRLKLPHDLIPDMVREFEISGYTEGDIPFHVGQISYIQEPGYKLRAVANPARVWQYVLAPLGDFLFGKLRGLRDDFTFDQDAGIEKVKSFLGKGNRVYSVDLSDATNNFPLTYTLRLLMDIVPKELMFLVNLFGAISRSPWLTPEGDLVQWTVGQPLGLFPSFAAFALSHHALLMTLSESCSGEFALLGDDVVIVGDDLYSAYVSALEASDIPVSMSKTLNSYEYAEFAGRLIGPEVVYMGHKYSRVTPDSFFDIVKELGPDFAKTLPSRYKKLIEEFGFLPEPFGFGWNPKGIPLADRISGLEDIYLKGRPLPKGTDRKYVCSFMLSKVMELSISAAVKLQTLPVERQAESLLTRRPAASLTGLDLLIRMGELGLPVAECVRTLEAMYRSAYRELDGTLVILDTEENRAARDLYFSLTEHQLSSSKVTRFMAVESLLRDINDGR